MSSNFKIDRESRHGMHMAFYTDLGHEPQVVDGEGNVIELERFAVWIHSPRGKWEVVETFDNLPDLIDRWGVIPEREIKKGAS